MLETATAKEVDCRVITRGTTECNPYSLRLIKAQEIKYDLGRKKLIVVKILPIPPQRLPMKVVSVADMIEKYVKVEDSMRFKGTKETPLMKAKKERIYTSIEKIKIERKKLFDKMLKFKKEKEERKLEALAIIEEEKRIELEEKRKNQGSYVVEKGDSLNSVAAKFNLKTNALRILNNLEKKSPLYIGEKLTIPYNQKKVDAIVHAVHIVEKGDVLGLIAKDYNLTSEAIMEYNNLNKDAKIRLGQKILLPLPHIVKKNKTKLIREYDNKKFSKSFGKQKLRVTATAYTSHKNQTSNTPFLAAWNNRLRPGMKVIAVSRDMLTKYGMRNGTKVRIAGLPGFYRVRDKMNKRYKKRIDIYMGIDRRKALRWGRRNVVIYWGA